MSKNKNKGKEIPKTEIIHTHTHESLDPTVSTTIDTTEQSLVQDKTSLGFDKSKDSDNQTNMQDQSTDLTQSLESLNVKNTTPFDVDKELEKALKETEHITIDEPIDFDHAGYEEIRRTIQNFNARYHCTIKMEGPKIYYKEEHPLIEKLKTELKEWYPQLEIVNDGVGCDILNLRKVKL